MLKIYLSGAMSCYSTKKEANEWKVYVIRLITEYCNMTDSKFYCFNPCDYYNYWTDQKQYYSEKEAMRYDLNMLKNCNLVIVNLKDLDKSIGTSDEILYAYLHNIPIIGFCEEKEFVLHPWKEEQIDRIETGNDALKKAVKYVFEYYL